MESAEYHVEFSAASKMWVVKDSLGRVISHYAIEGRARGAAKREGRKMGRRTVRSPFDNRPPAKENGGL